ncbi:MAG: response regulator [Actinomycetota bacterium]
MTPGADESIQRLAAEVAALRKTAGLSRQELARRAVVAQSAIARLERGQIVPSIPTLQRIAKALGLQIEVAFRPQERTPAGAEQADTPASEKLGVQSDEPIRVLVMDSMPLVSDAIVNSLARFPDMVAGAVESQTGLAPTGLEAADAATQEKPDIVVLDYWLPVMDGPSATRVIRKWAPDTKVLLMSWWHGPPQVQAALEAGAGGFLPKSASVAGLADAIRRAHRGQPLVYAEELAHLVETIQKRAAQEEDRQDRLLALTPKEIDILRLLSHGLSMKEIIKMLSITEATLRTHIQHIMSKTGAASRTEAIAMARMSGLLQSP